MQCSHPVDASETTRILYLRHRVGQVCFRYSLRCSGGALHGSDQRTDTASFQGQLRVPLCPVLHESLPAAPAVFLCQAGDLSLEPGAAPLRGAVPKPCLQEGSSVRAPGSGLGSGPRTAPRPGRLLPPGYLELEGALGALGDLLVEALLGVVGQLERDLGGPRGAGRQCPHQQQGRQRPPGALRRHRPARREARRTRRVRRARRGCGAAGLGAACGTRRGRGDERRHPEVPARRQRLPGALPGRVSGGEGAGEGRARGGRRAGEGRSWRLPLPASCRRWRLGVCAAALS